MPLQDLASLVVKCIAISGSRADFEALPETVQKAVLQEIDLYRQDGKWLMISNMGREDYAPYAEAFLEKLLRNTKKPSPVKVKRDVAM